MNNTTILKFTLSCESNMHKISLIKYKKYLSFLSFKIVNNKAKPHVLHQLSTRHFILYNNRVYPRITKDPKMCYNQHMVFHITP